MLSFLLSKIRLFGAIVESLPFVLKILNKVKSTIKTTIRTTIKLIPHFIFGVICSAIALVLILKAPGFHNTLTRHFVGSKVYMIEKFGVGGGTGFAFKVPSGKSYILTNDHICAMAESDGILMVYDNEGHGTPRKVIERSNFTDLCLMEGMPGVEGLSLGDKPEIGEIYTAVGHPALKPLILTSGEIVGRRDVQTVDHILHLSDPNDMCNKPKQSIEREEQQVSSEVPQEDKFYCIDTTKAAYESSIQVFGGSSGSPVVNLWGHVVGVVFATDHTNWASIISLDDIKTFTSKY
jgi:S1-C subfamily serine protease